MCFGNTQTSQKDTTYSPNPAIASAATQNVNFAQNLQNQGFTPYTANQVAPFGQLQQSSFDQAGSGQVPGMINNYANAGPQSVNPNTISSAMSPYMNQYVNMALAPQIQGQQQQFDAQNQQLNSAATSSGAFGDSRAGIQAANLTNQQNLARQGLIGSAYNSAFNTAIGAGAQDVANNLTGQTTNASLQEQALNRQLQGANALQANTGFQNTLGQQQTAQSQAGLNAQYNQWLMGQQRPFQTTQLLNSALQSGTYAMPPNQTQTTSQPDNSGFQMLGALGGAALGSFVGMPGLGAGLGSALGGSMTPNGGGSPSAYMQGGSAYGATPSYQNGGMYPMYPQ